MIDVFMFILVSRQSIDHTNMEIYFIPSEMFYNSSTEEILHEFDNRFMYRVTPGVVMLTTDTQMFGSEIVVPSGFQVKRVFRVG
jgi:hypothetical protein